MLQKLTSAEVSPQGAKALLDAGYTVHVERSSDRIYKDDEYSAAGAELVPPGSWVDAPKEHFILGLKELPEEDTPLKHDCESTLYFYSYT